MADAPDPAPQETTATEAPPAAPVRRRSGFLPLVAGGALAAALGFGAAQYVPLWQDTGETAALQAAIATLEAQLSELPEATKALSDRLAALEGAAPPDLAPLEGRIAALEQSAARPADPTALAALQVQIDALKAGGVPAAAIADVQAAFDAKLAEAQARLDEVRAGAEAIATASAQRAALLQLQSALDSGAPFAAALDALAPLEIPAVLAENDASGLPTLQALREGFPDAARAALDAALRANMGESWADRVQNFLLNQTGARSLTPREGNDPDAILSRAEAALATGDLSAVLAETAALPPEAQAAMQGWLDRANLRQQAIQAVQSLISLAGL